MSPQGPFQRWATVALITWVWATSSVLAQEKQVSHFGKYEGYSTETYQSWQVTSQYITMRDGVKLAIDVIRPEVDGKPTNERLPVIWTHSRYHRSPQAMNPLARSMVDARPDLQRLCRHGYVVAAVGVRGSGASSGRYEGLFSPSETKDSYEIIDWLAKQPWCNGNVGMFGGSYLGMTQYMAASQAHPALKAIFPDVAGFDMYDVIYPGGIYRQDMIQHWGLLTRQLDTQFKPPKVDADEDGSQLAQATAEHQGNWDVIDQYRKSRYRDTRLPEHSFATHNPSAVLSAINRAKVPAYHWNGFFDIFVTDSALWYANYRGPQKLGIGPWPHSTTPDRRFLGERLKIGAIEQHRWFDYWLKEIQNGVMDEPSVNYAVLVDPNTWVWRSAKKWPPATSKPVTWYLGAGPSESVDSTNDGTLTRRKPDDDTASDRYQIDLTTTTGTATRWDNAVGAGPLRYGDMTDNDKKCMTYTTAPLERDITITGHPVAELHIDCSAGDCDIYVLLEEVDKAGISHYVTEGVLRASHREVREAPWNNLALPYQRSFERDKKPLAKGQTTMLQLDLHPTATVFNRSHRLRISIMCADKDNTELLEQSAGETLTVHRSRGKPSRMILPVEQKP